MGRLMSLSYNKLEQEYNKALERIRDLEMKLYYCCRNKKIEDEVQKRK